MDDPKNKDNATVLKPRPLAPAAKTAAPTSPAVPDSATVIKKFGPSLDTDQARALTKIGKALQASGSDTGFDKARQAANSALASNKIILNNRFVLDSIISGGGRECPT